LDKFTILFLYDPSDPRNVPLQIMQCAKFGACAVGWSLCFTAFNSDLPVSDANTHANNL